MGHFSAQVLVLLDADGEAFELPLRGCPLATVEDLALDGHGDDLSRVLISLTARAGSAAPTATAGRGAGKQAASGSCSQRILWSDEALFGDAGGTAASSAERGAFVRSRLVPEARTFYWSLILLPGCISEVSISARVERVEGASADLEAMFGVPWPET